MPAGNLLGMLTVKDTMTLDLERRWWKYAGAKDATIREHFGETPTRYYQRLSALLDRPEVLAYDPLLVGRLRRLRDARAALRAQRVALAACPLPTSPPD